MNFASDSRVTKLRSSFLVAHNTDVVNSHDITLKYDLRFQMVSNGCKILQASTEIFF